MLVEGGDGEGWQFAITAERIEQLLFYGQRLHLPAIIEGSVHKVISTAPLCALYAGLKQAAAAPAGPLSLRPCL